MKIEGVGSVSSNIKISNNNDKKNKEVRKIDEQTNTGKTPAPDNNDRSEKNDNMQEKQVLMAVERANIALRSIDKRFEFSIHEATKEIMVKVIDDETEEIIREIPPEKILDMVAKMWEMIGILVDRKI